MLQSDLQYICHLKHLLIIFMAQKQIFGPLEFFYMKFSMEKLLLIIANQHLSLLKTSKLHLLTKK